MRKIVMLMLGTLMLTTFWIPACWAGEPAAPQLKLNEAITMAIKNSKSAQKAKLGIEKAEGKRDYIARQVTFAPMAGVSSIPAVDSAWYSLLSADLSWQMSKKSYGVEEDRLALNASQKYWNVQKAMLKVRSKELAVSKAELALRRTQAMVRLGMLPAELPPSTSPQVALSNAEAGLARAKSDLTAAQNELNSAYDALNQMVGLPAEGRPLLTDDIKFGPLVIDSLDAALQRVLDASPSIWQAEESVKMAKYAQESMWATGQYSPHTVRQAELEQAQLDAMSARDTVNLATRSLYYTVRNLEAGIQTAEKALAGAENALRVAKLQYELGMITKEGLVQSEVSLTEAKQSLLDLTTQHAYFKLAFQKPWAVSTS